MSATLHKIAELSTTLHEITDVSTTSHKIADVSQHCKRLPMFLRLPRQPKCCPPCPPPPMLRSVVFGCCYTIPNTTTMMLHQTSDDASTSNKTAAVAIRHCCPLPLLLPLPSQSFNLMLHVLHAASNGGHHCWLHSVLQKKTIISQTLKKIASKQAVHRKIEFDQNLILLPPQLVFCAIVPLNTSFCHHVVLSVASYCHPIKRCPSVRCVSNMFSCCLICRIILSSFQFPTIDLSRLLQANLDH